MQLPRLSRGARATLIVSDATRDEPRVELAAAALACWPDARWTLAIATGTHAASLPNSDYFNNNFHDIIVHDGHRGENLVEIGSTTRGTPVRLHRCVLDADLVVATGCIRPHYFAGFGAGSKSIFPGLGEARAIRMNHRWKTSPMARSGVLDGNPCRDDIEEAVGLVPTPIFLLNAVSAPAGNVHAVVSGDRVAAFRAGAELARQWWTVSAVHAPIVIASDHPPVTTTLYQAAKIAAAAAPLVQPGGLLVVAAECGDGIGPVDTVNEDILRIGVLPRLASGVRIGLVSSLPSEAVWRTLISPLASVDEALAGVSGPVVVIPRASGLIYA
jgi:nickel-dependent lactate racemase